MGGGGGRVGLVPDADSPIGDVAGESPGQGLQVPDLAVVVRLHPLPPPPN